MKNATTIKLNVKPAWAVGKGHATHKSGSGKHDSRTKRVRTRAAVNGAAMKDW